MSFALQRSELFFFIKQNQQEQKMKLETREREQTSIAEGYKAVKSIIQLFLCDIQFKSIDQTFFLNKPIPFLKMCQIANPNTTVKVVYDFK